MSSEEIQTLTNNDNLVSDSSSEICSINPLHEEATYHCRSCGIIGDKSICPSCARKCHQNHCLSFSGHKINSCSCGQCCHCYIKNTGELPNITLTCSNSDNDQVTIGPHFSCLDCSTENQTICPACAKTCHAGHRLIENPIGEFVCNCGLGNFESLCQFTQKTCLKCDFDKYGSKPMHGLYYICRDCFPVLHTSSGSYSICANCARICHAGHNVVPVRVSDFYCDCGAGECRKVMPCKFWKKPGPDDHCTFTSASEKVNGDYFICETCTYKKSDVPLEMCPSCAKICHANHRLTKKNGEYVCLCGEGSVPKSCCHFH